MSGFWGRSAARQLLGGMPRSVREVLQSIEAEEESWSAPPPDECFSYGRIPGEELVRFWSVPRTTGALLFWLCTDPNVLRVVEVGTSVGYSTIWMAQALSLKAESSLLSWEIMHEKAEMARENVEGAGLDSVVSVRNENAVEYFDSASPVELESGVDLMFIDADKENHLNYLRGAERCVGEGGIVVMDNAVDFGGLAIECHSYAANSDKWIANVLEIDNGLLMLRRTDT